MKLVKSSIVFLALLIVAMMSPAAFAGTITWFPGSAANNSAVTVALEAMGTARNYPFSNGTTTLVNSSNTIKITPSQQLASGSLLTISFTNAGFDGTQVLICANNGSTNVVNTPVAVATPSANATSQAFVLGSAVSSGSFIALLTDNNSASNCATANASFIARLQPMTSAGMVSVSYSVALSGTTYDSASAVNIGNVASSFSTSFAANNSTIDFLNAPANGSTFAGNTTAANYVNGSFTLTSMNVTVNSSNVVNAGLTTSAIINLQDSASWQGVRRAWLANANANCAAVGVANNVAVNNAPSGTVSLNVPSASFNGAATGAVSICADVLGNTTINSRTITAASNISVGSGGVSPGLSSYSTIMTWAPNGYQGVVPYISADSTYKTICFINNTSSSSVAITADILSSESSATLTSLQAVSLGTVGASSTKRIDFAGDVTPYTYSSGTETAGTARTLTGLQSNDRYSARINVATSPASVTVNCIQVDPAGSKRALPVLTSGSTASYLVQ